MTTSSSPKVLVGSTLVRVPVAQPVQTLERTASGLLYATDFSDLDGWTADTGWSTVADPSLVCFGKFPRGFFNSAAVDAEDQGVREPQLYVEDDTWWLLYDAGSGSTGWRQFLASSTDEGLTWTRHGEVVGLDNGAGGSYAAVATGWLEKRGATYYLHRVTAGSTFPSPNVGLPADPYRWDTWSAASPLGPWTFVNKTDAPGGSWVSTTYLPCSVVKVGATYTAYIQGANGDSYRIGFATATSPTGPWTLDATPRLSSATFGGRYPENPKVFYHPDLARWVILINLIATSGLLTDRNAVTLSDSLTDLSGAKHETTQSTGPIDTTDATAVGVQCHVTGPDGALVYDADSGAVPLLFDGSPVGASPGWHLGRTIHASELEPSSHAARFTSGTSSNFNLVRALAHTDFDAEFAVKFRNATLNTNVGLWFRMDASLANGYRLVVRNTEKLLLQKVTAGSVSTLLSATSSTYLSADGPRMIGRIRVKATGSTLKAWFDGQLQINVTDASFASGVKIALSGFAADADVRLLSIRTGLANLVITGLDPGAAVVIRSRGGLPVSAAVADGTGIATITDLTHGPYKTLEVDGLPYAPEGGIWPGDTFALA